MITEITVAGYEEIISQAGMSRWFAAKTRKSGSGRSATSWESDGWAYRHAAVILLQANGYTEASDKADADIAATSWARATETIHIGTLRESCASHGCHGCKR